MNIAIRIFIYGYKGIELLAGWLFIHYVLFGNKQILEFDGIATLTFNAFK